MKRVWASNPGNGILRLLFLVTYLSFWSMRKVTSWPIPSAISEVAVMFSIWRDDESYAREPPGGSGKREKKEGDSAHGKGQIRDPDADGRDDEEK